MRENPYTQTNTEESRNIVEIARLVVYLNSDAPVKDKVAQIKVMRDDGYITSDEALDLTVEFIQ